jgi:hypothetical protein
LKELCPAKEGGRAAFVELTASDPSTLTECLIESESSIGGKIRIQWKASAQPDRACGQNDGADYKIGSILQDRHERNYGMRRWVLLGLFTAMTLPVGAAKRATVAQLEQALAAATAAQKADAEMARMIDGMELSERLSTDTLERIDARLNPGRQVTLAMQLLAAQSEFLDLPASELPVKDVPDQAAQLRMFEAATHYVAQTMDRLPNFLATRTTNRFDNSPQEVKKGAWPVRAGLHQVDRSSLEVSVHVEQESGLPGDHASAVWEDRKGLSSWGEFGTVLGMILGDAANGKVRWSHWEQIGSGMSAVFHYSVPKSASHFELGRLAVGPGTIAAVVTPYAYVPKAGAVAGGIITLHDKQGYEGSLWLDPATGTILRITIEADTKGNATYQRAAMLVQYGAVEIAGSRFILPVRSLALSKVAMSAEESTGDAPSEWLNETLFTGYHRFASTARILTGDQAQVPQ